MSILSRREFVEAAIAVGDGGRELVAAEFVRSARRDVRRTGRTLRVSLALFVIRCLPTGARSAKVGSLFAVRGFLRGLSLFATKSSCRLA